MKIKIKFIRNIGHTINQENGFTNFYCDFSTAQLEEIILDTILTELGYEIVETGDFCFQNSIIGQETVTYEEGMIYKTNLPYSIYSSIADNSFNSKVLTEKI